MFDGRVTRWRPSSPATLAVQCGLSERLDAETAPSAEAALRFDTGPQARLTQLVGAVELDAYLQFARDSNLAVLIEDVGPDGQAQLIGRAAVSLVADRSTRSAPGLYVIRLPALDHSLAAGHRLRLELSRGGAAGVKIYHARLYPSALVVRLIAGAGD